MATTRRQAVIVNSRKKIKAKKHTRGTAARADASAARTDDLYARGAKPETIEGIKSIARARAGWTVATVIDAEHAFFVKAREVLLSEDESDMTARRVLLDEIAALGLSPVTA